MPNSEAQVPGGQVAGTTGPNAAIRPDAVEQKPTGASHYVGRLTR